MHWFIFYRFSSLFCRKLTSFSKECFWFFTKLLYQRFSRQYCKMELLEFHELQHRGGIKTDSKRSDLLLGGEINFCTTSVHELVPICLFGKSAAYSRYGKDIATFWHIFAATIAVTTFATLTSASVSRIPKYQGKKSLLHPITSMFNLSFMIFAPCLSSYKDKNHRTNFLIILKVLLWIMRNTAETTELCYSATMLRIVCLTWKNLKDCRNVSQN